jgi:acyl-ACP thioesterase
MRPGIADADGSGRCRLDAMARWLQDIAYADLVDAGFEGRGAWIVRRTGSERRLPLRGGPRCGRAQRHQPSPRAQDSLRGRGETVSLWICLDPERRRPMRFPPEFLSIYGESAGGRGANVRLRHPDPPEGADRSTWTFRASEMDPAGHINNSHYWTPVEEELAAGQEPERIDAEVEFRDPAMPGEVALLRDGSSLWIAGAEGTVHASILRG